MISLDSVLARQGDVFYRHVPPETVVIRQGGPEVMVFSDVAGRILDLIDGRATLREVAARLAGEYDASRETLERDVLDFGEELIESAVVSVVAITSVAAPPGGPG